MQNARLTTICPKIGHREFVFCAFRGCAIVFYLMWPLARYDRVPELMSVPTISMSGAGWIDA
jgi:hypothetical protein